MNKKERKRTLYNIFFVAVTSAWNSFKLKYIFQIEIGKYFYSTHFMNDQSVFSHPRQKRHLKSSPDKIEIEKHLGKRIWANGILAQFKDYILPNGSKTKLHSINRVRPIRRSQGHYKFLTLWPNFALIWARNFLVPVKVYA